MAAYRENVVTLDDFSTDTIGAGKYTAQQGPLSDWVISAGTLTSTGGGVQVYRNDVAAADLRVRGEHVGTRTGKAIALRKADGSGWTLMFPQDSNNFQWYSYTSGFSFSSGGAPGATTPSLVHFWELAKEGNQLRARSFMADSTLIDDVLLTTLTGSDITAVCNPAFRADATGAPLPAFDSGRYATLAAITTGTARGVARRAKVARRGKVGGFKGGGGSSARPTGGQLWPRGNRGK